MKRLIYINVCVCVCVCVCHLVYINLFPMFHYFVLILSAFVDVLDIFVIIVCLLFVWSKQSIRCAIAFLNPIAVVFAIK